MKKKILLLDGLSIANRAFYGIPLLTTKNGVYTNAVYGFLNIMLSMIEKEKPDLVGIAFDVSAPTFRHEKCESYKGTRKGMPEELKSQIPLLKQVLQHLGIYMLEKSGFEADDILGTLAKQAEIDGLSVVVVSGDRDLLQITSEQIELKIPKTKSTGTEIESYFAKDVQQKYEVTPLEFIDVKGLMGDASDNIKGVPSIGEKTAIKLIKEYHSIENIYEHIEEIKQKKLKENLITYREQALESKMLATIICNVELEYSWEEFRFDLCLDEEADKLFKELELKKLMTKLPKKVSDKEQEIEVSYQDMQPDRVKDFIGQEETLAIAYFIEELTIGLGITTSNQIICVKYDMSKESEKENLRALFENKYTKKIIHDTKYLRHGLAKWNIELEGEIFDSFIAAYVLQPTNDTYDLAELNENFLGEKEIPSIEDLLGKGKSMKKWSELEKGVLHLQLCERAKVLFELYEQMNKQLVDFKMEELFYQIEMPLVRVLFDMEQEGISIHPEELKTYGQELDVLIEEAAKAIYEYAGEEFNINSPKQLGVILFEKMDIPPIKKTKTGYSTAAEVLETLKDKYPIVEKILEYRQYVKLKSTYVDGLLNVMADDNKIHSTFNQTITATGRISSTEPNLQNIPIRLELGRKIRKVFIPKSEEYIFLDADYSQIELRVLAAMAEDETLINAFKQGIDIHTLTASQVLHVPFDEVTSKQRYNAKAVNFGIVYGIGAFSLAEDLKITQKEAQQYIDSYFEKYPKIKGYLESIIEFAKENGYVTTLFNRRREIPEIQAKNFNVREFGKRVAMNTPIQGTAADIIKIAMVKVHNRLKEKKLKSKLILTVHDELLLEVYKPEVDTVRDLMKEEMEHAVSLSVPLSVEVHSGENWFETK
ncbi:MAG: DNA polymerase I [Cellulosilyticaceae bacterium]